MIVILICANAPRRLNTHSLLRELLGPWPLHQVMDIVSKLCIWNQSTMAILLGSTVYILYTTAGTLLLTLVERGRGETVLVVVVVVREQETLLLDIRKNPKSTCGYMGLISPSQGWLALLRYSLAYKGCQSRQGARKAPMSSLWGICRAY